MKIGGTLYLDHQATTALDSQVLEEMLPHLADRFGNPHSTDHAMGWLAAQAVERAAGQVAALLGADADEVIFTSGATEANNLALLGFGRRAADGKRKRILIGVTEHKSILTLGRVLQDRFGYTVTLLPVDCLGRLNLHSLEESLDDDVLLVSIMAVNNEVGTIQDVAAISRMVSAYGAKLHCDCAQAPCAMDLSTMAGLVDFLSLSAHKMYGPMGIGALYIRRDLQGTIEPIIYGGGQQNGLRSGTVPTALCVGFGASAKLLAGASGLHERTATARRRDKFRERLKDTLQAIWFNGPSDRNICHPGNLNVGFEGVSASDLLARIQPRLAASTGSACTSGIPEPSHVLRAIGLDERRANSCVRFSLGRYTTDEDVAGAVEIICSVLEDTRATA